MLGSNRAWQHIILLLAWNKGWGCAVLRLSGSDHGLQLAGHALVLCPQGAVDLAQPSADGCCCRHHGVLMQGQWVGPALSCLDWTHRPRHKCNAQGKPLCPCEAG